MVFDPVADFLTRLRNGALAKLRFVDIRGNKLIRKLVEILKEQGFVSHFLVKPEHGQETIRVFLKYDAKRQCLLQGAQRVSKPGGRIYVSHDKIPFVKRGMGAAILTTPQGVMIGHEARQRRLGGEVVCKVW